MGKIRLAALVAALSLALSGCMMKTVDEMYRLPKRSEDDNNLQAAIDGVMSGLEYSAPIQGDNQQTVQMADLNGDGRQEALVFAKGTDDRPLKIFVFTKQDGNYVNTGAIQTAGTTFEQVEYVDIDDAPGLELVVGRQVGNEVLHSLSVYSFGAGQADTILTAGYTRYITADLDNDQRRELVVLRPGADTGNGVAEMYDYHRGVMERDTEAAMSVPVESMKRLTSGGMYGNVQGVFAASVYDEDTIITDVFAVVEGRFTNVSLSSESATSVKTIRNYYVYGDDIDNDGLVEIPAQVYPDTQTLSRQDLLRWYNLTPRGEEVDKAYTFHNYVEHWYMALEEDWMRQLHVTRGNGVGQTQGYVFSLEDKAIFTVYAFTGDDREQAAQSDGRFILNRTDEVVYAAALTQTGRSQGLSEETLIDRLNSIREDWRTGEM